jgi:hypothetical protein
MKKNRLVVSEDIEVSQPFEDLVCISRREEETGQFINIDKQEANRLVKILTTFVETGNIKPTVTFK